VCRNPLLGVRVEHLPDEVLCAMRNARPRVAGEVNLPSQDGVEDTVLRFCVGIMMIQAMRASKFMNRLLSA
jgi:hypothetical protein